MIIGIYGGLAGLAVAMGPIIGGAVTEGLDWHWIFWINVPIGAVALPLAMRLLPESHGARSGSTWRRHARHRRRRRHRVGAGPREPGGLDKPGDRRLPAGRRGPAARLRRLGTAGARADGAAAAVPQPGVRGRQRHDVPHVRCDLRRRLSRHPGVPVRPRLLAGLGRGAPAAVLRHADGHLADRGRRLRPHRASAGHGDRPDPAGAGFVWVAARGSLATSWIELESRC